MLKDRSFKLKVLQCIFALARKECLVLKRHFLVYDWKPCMSALSLHIDNIYQFKDFQFVIMIIKSLSF